MSLPQQQIGFKQSRKLCLNLWSLKWFKRNLNLVISLIPIGLWQLKVLLEVGCMNCKIQNPFLKKSETFRTPNTFVKIIPLNYSERKEQVLKKVCLTLNIGMLSILFLILYAVLLVEILSKRYLGDGFLVILKK